MPILWGTSAMLILTESGWLPLLVCLGCLCFAWKCCPSALRRRAIVSLLVFALPVQGFAGVSTGLRGPAHFHAHENSHHGHAQVARHHHAAGEDAIEVDSASRSAALAAGEDKRAAFGPLDASTAAAFGFPSQSLPGAILAEPAAKLAAHIPHGPERPPSCSAIS